MLGFRGVDDVDRVSVRAARIRGVRKAGVIIEVVPHDGDGIRDVEVVGCPSDGDCIAFSGVVGGLSRMTDSSRRRGL